MPTEMEKIHKDLVSLKKDMAFIRHVLKEDYELSNRAKKELRKARKTPKSKYVDLNELD